MKLNIREEQLSDFSQIIELTIQAFENEEHSDHTEQDMVERMRLSNDYIAQLALVAEVDGIVVGHILMSHANIVNCDKIHQSLALAPVSVVPKFQGKGIGSALIVEAHRRAVDLGYTSAVLLGHKDYYHRFGYRPAVEFGITFPFDVETEYCQAVELTAGSLKGIHGTVHFAAALLG